ncbi:MAG TPA: extracellular solute-binding protein [Polyangiaceae bacterium]|nr:extracellular solute-binding protein [Polyangiaceae bacterium]
MTPHDATVRYEFSHAFASLLQSKGRSVEIDWRTPGGGSEITRILDSQYSGAFENHWKGQGQRWSNKIASQFATPCDPAKGCDQEVEQARAAFLQSNVGCGVDLLFGGGSVDADINARAGRLVDSGVIQRHPELFPKGDEVVGGEAHWDPQGRWLGVSLSGFGICVNRDALRRLGIRQAPDSWESLGRPAYRGQLALADPSKSSSALKGFEMLVQEQMRRAYDRAESSGIAGAERDKFATREGWLAALRLIQRLAANARYFSDAASNVPVDVAMGSAAAGMCIDSYGGLQSEVTAATGDSLRMGFELPTTGTSIGADTIGLLRGAPHRSLAVEFIEFVVSEAGQKIWSFRRGTPGGPQRHALHRLPVNRSLYAPAYDQYRSDPISNPYDPKRTFTYHKEWTQAIYRDIAFVVRVMCIDPLPELKDAYSALAANGFPAEATALFEDTSATDYVAVTQAIHRVLRSGTALEQVDLTTRLVRHYRDQYLRVAAAARSAPGKH